MRLVPDSTARPQRRFTTLVAAVAAVAAAAVLALAVGTIVAGRGNGPAPGHVGNRAQIPWSQVGADWTLIVTTPKASDASGTLYLVDASGRRYEICTLHSEFLLVAQWSVGTGRALVTRTGFHSKDSNEILLVDLHTGSQTKLAVPINFNTVQFADANQSSILATSPFKMLTVTETGRRVSNFPGSDFWGSVVSPDGSQVVAGNPAGLTVFDAAGGRRVRTLAPPAGYGDCAAIAWASGSDVSGVCYSRTQKSVVADFLFSAAGRHPPTPESVPSGWDAVSFSRGVVAIEHNSAGRYEPRDVRFARVGTGGRLTPLTLPSQLQQAGWGITSIGADSFLLERIPNPPDGLVDELVSWDPLTGKLVSLFQADRDHASLISYAGWRAYPA